MEIRVWQSYSCNNSSNFRLVARFGDAKTAAESAAELKQFFKEHAKQADKALDAAFDSGVEDAWPPPATKACEALAAKYGFKWKEFLGWGDDGLAGDEPVAIASDETLVIYHGYCGGFPKEVTQYLKARGATKVEREEMDAPEVSVLFKIPSNGKKLEDSLTKLFAQAEGTEYIDNWTKKPPWSGEDQPDDYSKNVAFFSDTKTIGFYLPIDPEQIEKLKKYLGKHGVDNPAIRLCEPSDRKKFQAIAGSRCEACDAPLSYIDPRTHQIESEQLACDNCGAMFDLATVAKKKKRKPKPKPAIVVEAAAAPTKKTKTAPNTKLLMSKKKKTASKKKTTTTTKKKAASKKKK